LTQFNTKQAIATMAQMMRTDPWSKKRNQETGRGREEESERTW